jgi:hypothetical protein
MCFLAFAFTAPMRKLRLLVKRWRMSLLLATPGAKSLGTLALCFGTLPRRDGEQRATAVCFVTLKIVQFLALAFTALALVPSGAHLFELPGKIGLGAEQYFIVQNVYRGWSLFGIVLFGALIANLALALVLRNRGAPFALALFACFCIALTLVVFFIWTYPANQATDNWMIIPNNWEQLRREWEYSHAANAVVTFMAFCSVSLSVVMTRE